MPSRSSPLRESPKLKRAARFGHVAYRPTKETAFSRTNRAHLARSARDDVLPGRLGARDVAPDGPAARAFRRPAPRTGSPPARIGGTTPTDDPASLGAAALIAKGEAAVRLGRYERANEAFAAARAVTAAEKERGSPPSLSGLGDDG